jgi:hypothetical protein
MRKIATAEPNAAIAVSRRSPEFTAQLHAVRMNKAPMIALETTVWNRLRSSARYVLPEIRWLGGRRLSIRTCRRTPLRT